MKSLVLAVFCAIAVSSASADQSDGSGAHGGDVYAQEFKAIGFDILSRLSLNPIPEVDNARLAQAVASADVSSQPELELDGRAVDAINYPDLLPRPKIVISRVSWDKMKQEPFRKLFLAFHEYLSVIGVDDSDYRISLLLDRARVCQRTPEIRQAIEAYFHISCDRIGAVDLASMKELHIRLKPGTSELRPGDFGFMSNLEVLNLMDPKLSGIPPELFEDLPRLAYFGLRCSSIVSDDCGYLGVFVTRQFAFVKTYLTITIDHGVSIKDADIFSFSGFPKGARIRFTGEKNERLHQLVLLGNFACNSSLRFTDCEKHEEERR